MSWYPEPKPVPDTLDTADLHLEMLAPKHVDMDLDALLSSRGRLMQWSGGRWPHEGFTREENMEDMVMHRDEFLAREAFAYTVLNKSQDRVEGCIYIEPLHDGPPPADAGNPVAALPESTARVAWWVRDDALDRDLDHQLITGLADWFRTAWQFDAVTFLVRGSMQRDLDVLESAGMTLVTTVEPRHGEAQHSLYRLALPEQ